MPTPHRNSLTVNLRVPLQAWYRLQYNAPLLGRESLQLKSIRGISVLQPLSVTAISVGNWFYDNTVAQPTQLCPASLLQPTSLPPLTWWSWPGYWICGTRFWPHSIGHLIGWGRSTPQKWRVSSNIPPVWVALTPSQALTARTTNIYIPWQSYAAAYGRHFAQRSTNELQMLLSR